MGIRIVRGDSCTELRPGRRPPGNYDPDMPDSDGKRERSSTAVGGTILDRLRGKRVCICVGAGGVGKTTTSAALALGLAIRGQKVAVVTIDPAGAAGGALGPARALQRARRASSRRRWPRRASR